MNGIGKSLIYRPYQDVGQDTTDTCLGIALGGDFLHQVFHRTSTSNRILYPIGQFFIDLKNLCQIRMGYNLITEQLVIILSRYLWSRLKELAIGHESSDKVLIFLV